METIPYPLPKARNPTIPYPLTSKARNPTIRYPPPTKPRIMTQYHQSPTLRHRRFHLQINASIFQEPLQSQTGNSLTRA